jgi:hypothetical protein
MAAARDGLSCAHCPVRKNVAGTLCAARVKRMLDIPFELATASKVRATTGRDVG